jgi:hypothetical protein
MLYKFLEKKGLYMELDVLRGNRDVQGKRIAIMYTKKKGVVTIFPEKPAKKKFDVEVIGVEWTHGTGRSAGTTAIGAIGGGLLAGGIGAIAGAALGGRKKDQSTGVLHFADGNNLVVHMSAKEFQQLQGFKNLRHL